MLVHATVRDGWDSWESLWAGGYDQPFFSALAELLGKKHQQPPPQQVRTSNH
jgi:hypothetical protein